VYDEEVIGEALKAAQFMREAREQDGVVFVHCAMGKSRSVSAIIMFLMVDHQMTYDQSL
jgi:protein-tyrosine phosphatase